MWYANEQELVIYKDASFPILSKIHYFSYYLLVLDISNECKPPQIHILEYIMKL